MTFGSVWLCVSLDRESESPPPVTEGGVQREDDRVQNRCCLQSQPNSVSSVCVCVGHIMSASRPSSCVRTFRSELSSRWHFDAAALRFLQPRTKE